MTSELTLKIASLNCKGLNKKLKRKHVFSESNKYDIVCLQETYVTEKTAKEWMKEWRGEFSRNLLF